MNLQELLYDIFDLILENISPIIDPIINEKGKNDNTLDEIKSIISKWFDENDVFSLSIKHVRKLSDGGTVFTNENNGTITVEDIIKRFKERGIVENVKTALFENYGKKIPNMHLFNCPTGMKPFYQTNNRGGVESFGCTNNKRFRK